MKVYVDKENLLSLLQSHKDEKFEDCLRMLQKQCDVYFNFSRYDILSIPPEDVQREKLVAFITELCDGKWKCWHRLEDTDAPYPARPIQGDIYNAEIMDIQAVYLINDSRADFVKKEGCLLISPVGEEVSTLSSLILGDDYEFHKSICIRDLQSWTDTNTYLSPCTDIIFVDRYIFKADNETLKNNVYPLIAQLAGKAKQKKIKICFVTDKDDNNYPFKWNEIISNIKEYVKKKTKTEPYVTIVKMPKRGLPDNLREHDRTIFTNYKYIYSGDTFSYFGHKTTEKTNIISSGRLLTLLSFGNHENQEIGNRFIADIQHLIDEVKKISSYYIEGDKKSNFLIF